MTEEDILTEDILTRVFDMKKEIKALKDLDKELESLEDRYTSLIPGASKDNFSRVRMNIWARIDKLALAIGRAVAKEDN